MEIWILVPLPLVVKLLQLAKCWHGQELPWYTDCAERWPREHPMKWTFASSVDAMMFYNFSMGLVHAELRRAACRQNVREVVE